MNIDTAQSLFSEALDKLHEREKLRDNTIKTYKYCLNAISDYLKANNCNTMQEFKGNMAVKFFRDTRICYDYKQFRKYMAAVRKLETEVFKMEKYLIFGDTELELFAEAKKHKRINVYSGSGLEKDIIQKKINALKNKKLKLGYRLGLVSGLRVSELSELKKDDINFVDEQTMEVQVNDGKGGKARLVKSLPDKYTVKNLKEYFTDKATGNKLFYSAKHMKNKASQIGIQMHDLRRCFASDLLEQEIKKGNSKDAAKEVVRQALGHEDIKTTEIYLKNRKKR